MGDYSDNYTNSKDAYIFFYYQGQVIKFKPFIDDLSYEMEKNSSTNQAAIYNSMNKETSFKFAKFDLGFNVLATNIKEARQNHMKFQLLIRMNTPKLGSYSVPKTMYVKFSNLIQQIAEPTYDLGDYEILENGFKCIITNVKYEPIMDLGFFEHEGMIFAKGFKITVELKSALADKIADVPIYYSGFSYGASGPAVSTSNLPVDIPDPVVTTRAPALPFVPSAGMSRVPGTNQSLLGGGPSLDVGSGLGDIGQDVVIPQSPPPPIEIPSVDPVEQNAKKRKVQKGR